MDELNPCAINTVRIVTIYNSGDPYVFSAILRVGTKSTGIVDNAAAGGISVGISEGGKLFKLGIAKCGKYKVATQHPDTGVTFENFALPHYDEVIKAVCEAHKKFYNVHSIGWDIAITPDGISFIEGNDNWEISVHQMPCGGLKKEWEEACRL